MQNALDKLSASLRDDTTDVTPERRASLLQLVTKLQAGLAVSVPVQERRSSVQGRFRRRQRPNRHTVGVSSEELADARRLIEEISLHELTPQTSNTKISMLQKQNSEGCVGQNKTSSFKPFLTQKSVVKNAVAKPFSSSNSTVSGNSSSVQTPTDQSESLDLLFHEESDKRPDYSFRSMSLDDQNIHRSSSGDVSIKSVQQAVQQAAARKSTENLMESEETDEDTTMKALAVNFEEKKDYVVEPYKPLPQPDLIMQNNPIYMQQKLRNTEEKINKFNSKKLKMKRANTIDIPKPLNFYERDDDSDSSLPEEDYYQRRRSNYLALRGPIRVGNGSNNKNTLPVFEPKTDNDKKFLAFINKHNENSTAEITQPKNSIWSKPDQSHGSIWTNKFGNIKTAFEKASTGQVQSQNSARQFWKTADDAVTTGPKYDGPKISKQSARNLRQMFEEKQKGTQKLPWSPKDNIVTGSLKVKAFEPHNDNSHKFVPQPLPVNKFSHAPQSAFKPIPKKAPPSTLQICKTPIKTSDKEKEPESPLYLYSPKPSNEPSLKPWATNPGESRVLNLAASKFENVLQQEPALIKPRKLSKDKLVSPFQQQTAEKLSAPYLVKSVEQNNKNVRHLSGQYDNLNGKNNDTYATYSTVKYSPSSLEKKPNYSPQQNIHRQHAIPNHQPSHQNQLPQLQHHEYPQNQNLSHLPNNHMGDYYQNHNKQNRPQYSQLPQSQQHKHQNQQYNPQIQHYESRSQQFTSQNQTQSQPKTQNQNYESQHYQYKSHNQHNEPSKHQDYSNQQTSQPQYTSTYQYQPQTQNYTQKMEPQERQKPDVALVEVSTQPLKYESQTSIESLKEYNAVNSRVMTGPVSQQATTVRQKSPMNRDEHDMAAALNLRNSLQKINIRPDTSPQKPVLKEEPKKETPPSPNFQYKEESKNYIFNNVNYRNNEIEVAKAASPTNYKYPTKEPQRLVSPNSFSYKPRQESPKAISPHSFTYKNRETTNSYNYRNDKRSAPVESLEINANGESIVTSKFQIPVINVPQPESPRPPTQLQIANKAESWNQICMQNQQPAHKPSPRASPNARTVSKSKSSHSLALPKQFEAGMSKDEMAQKRKTMEAFLCGSKSPQSLSRTSSNDNLSSKTDTKVVKRSINRLKTSEKLTTYRHSSGLSRSRTLPDIVCPEMLDEENVDKAFEDLFKSSS